MLLVVSALIAVVADFGFMTLTTAIFSPLIAWWIIAGMWGIDPAGPRQAAARRNRAEEGPRQHR